MYKLLLFPLMLVIWLMMYAQQLDQEMAMKLYYSGKYAINRATHAAALQLDQQQLAQGYLAIDEEQALVKAKEYLYANLHLDDNGQPTEKSFLKEALPIVLFEVINADQTFPYVYENEQYGIKLQFNEPAVIIVATLKYPSIFVYNEFVEWNIVGSSQIVAP